MGANAIDGGPSGLPRKPSGDTAQAMPETFAFALFSIPFEDGALSHVK